MLLMPQVHQSGTSLRQNGIESSSLPMRQETWLASEVQSQEETKRANSTRDSKADNQASKERRSSQANQDLDHEAVKAYRDQFKFCPNAWRRREIILTCKNISLWKEVLASWGYWKDGKWIKYNPLNTNGMIQEYERRARNNSSVSKSRNNVEDCQSRIPRRSDSQVLGMQTRVEIEPRASAGTIEQIVSKALRETDRP